MKTVPLNVASLSKKEFDNMRLKPDNWLFFVYDEQVGEDGKVKTRIRLYKGAVLVSGDVNILGDNTSQVALYPKIMASGKIYPVVKDDAIIDVKIDMNYGSVSLIETYIDPYSRFMTIDISIDNINAYKDIIFLANPITNGSSVGGFVGTGNGMIGNIVFNVVKENVYRIYVHKDSNVEFSALGFFF